MPSMQRTAVFWIRDGVLVDRMHVNAVSFAVASLSYAETKAASRTNLAELVNFGFETSGISSADKMRQFNRERSHLIPDVAAAVDYYNALASQAASHCSYFVGVCDLVRRLKSAGVLSFITSAVEQSVLDAWAEGPQGKQLAPYLTEVLGSRPDFNKGRDHFAHVRKHYGVEKIFYVADAVAEITNGAQLSEQFKISPIGFAHVITPAKVMVAYKLVMDAHAKLSRPNNIRSTIDLALNEDKLSLPGSEALTGMLRSAQATHVVGGTTSEIIDNLAAYLETCGVLSKEEVPNG